MNFIGRAFTLILLIINIFVALLMILASYSHAINPIHHSILSVMGLAFPAFFIINLLFFFFWIFVYIRYALVSFITFIICFNSIITYVPFNIFKEDKPQNVIKFLSYNTMALGGLDNNKVEGNEIIDYLNNSDADIICLQEFIPIKGLSVKQINRSLGKYKYNDYLNLNNSNGLACFSRYPIISSEKINYKSRSNGSVAYKIKIDSDTVIVINNHLESNKITKDDKEMYREMILNPDKDKVKSGSKLLISKLASAAKLRAPQVDSVCNYIDRNSKYDIITCGDFNDSPLSYARYKIAERLKDAFVESGNGPGISYNRNHFYFRIDHILISPNFNSYNCTVDNSIKASDHYPIWCYIDLCK